MLLEERAGWFVTRYVYGPGGLPLAQHRTGGVVELFHHDQLGSTRVVTSAADGSTVAAFTYDAWGSVAASSGSVGVVRHGYAGQYTDAETGLQYLRARYYDPTTGQFLTRDPLVSVTREAYGYAANTPLNASDPSGLYPGEGLVNGGVSLVTRGVADCLDILDADCVTAVEANPTASQWVADFAAGVLDSVTFGNGEEITSGLGIHGNVTWGSGMVTFGQGVGFVVNLYGAASGGSAFAVLQAAGAVEGAFQSCASGWSAECGIATGSAALSSLLPFGAGQGARALGFPFVGYVEGFVGWGTDAGGALAELFMSQWEC